MQRPVRERRPPPRLVWCRHEPEPVEQLAARGLSSAELAGILQPAQLEVRFTNPERGRATRAEQIVAGLSTALVMLAVFTSMAYLLTGITSEKQLRVTDRTSLMFLPVLFVGLGCWTVLRDPDSPVARGLAIFPLTSSPALPVRAILSDVNLPEVGISLVLLLATIWLVWRAAGRIFEIGMLMYGKEPTLRELARWARG